MHNIKKDEEPEQMLARAAAALSDRCAELRACLTDAFASYCSGNPPVDRLPPRWVLLAPDLIGSERAIEIWEMAARAPSRTAQDEPGSEREQLLSCLADAFASYCKDNPDPDHLPEPWAELAQELIGSGRASEIFERAAHAQSETAEDRSRPAPGCRVHERCTPDRGVWHQGLTADGTALELRIEEREAIEDTWAWLDAQQVGEMPDKVRLVKVPPELYDGATSTFFDATQEGMEQLGKALADWLVDGEPSDGDTLSLELVEMTKEEFDAIPEV